MISKEIRLFEFKQPSGSTSVYKSTHLEPIQPITQWGQLWLKQGETLYNSRYVTLVQY